MEIKSFVPVERNTNNIYYVLDKYGIKLSDITSYEPSQYKWDRGSMFDYLTQCVDDDYYIIYDDGNRVVLFIENENAKYFLGDNYMDKANRSPIYLYIRYKRESDKTE